ncbi:MAG: ribosomal protein S18-alanine N-acetyltransferase [Candidatus Njordarchaeales archaeon]
MEDLKIRRAIPDDLNKVFEIEQKSFKRPYPKYYLAWLIKGLADIFLVAEYKGQVLGYVAGRIEYNRLGHVITIAVHPEWRRRGIGTKLMLYIMKLFREYGCERVYLEVRVSNLEAIRLYEKLGFRITRLLKNYYEDGEDAYLMLREL